MTNIDASKIKRGDTVGLLVDDVDETGKVWVEAGVNLTHFPASAIVSHTPALKPALKVGDRVRDPSGVELEIVGAPRASAANDGRPEITTWSQKHGYVVDVAAEVEQWERV